MLEAACHSEARWPSVAIGLLLYWAAVGPGRPVVAAEPRPAVVAAEPQLGRCGAPACPLLRSPNWGLRGARLGRLSSRYNQSHVSGASFVTLIALR